MMANKNEKGQTIILVIIVLFGLIAMAALMVDGGNAYFNRRDAQTAADAGALAGAYELCVEKGDTASVTAVITDYVETQNHALLDTATDIDDPSLPGEPNGWYIDADDNLVVNTYKVQNNFFAKIFGLQTTAVKATASAGCFPPGASDHVIPVAWSCKPPIGQSGETILSDSEHCTWKAIPWNVMKDIIGPDPLDEATNPILGETGQLLYHDDRPVADGGEAEEADEYLDNDSATNPNDTLQLYIVMDSIPLQQDLGCEIETDAVTGETIVSFCDLDGDGRFDVTTSERSWVLLVGDENQAQLDDIILGDMVVDVNLPTWFPGRDGNIVDVYKDAAGANGIEGVPSLIPVYNALCAPTADPEADSETLCTDWESGDQVEQNSTAASQTYFRVFTFAEFYTTCISYQHDCPGKLWLEAWLLDLADQGIIDKQDAKLVNVVTMEGYFIDGWAESTTEIGSNDIDLGVYVLSLTN